MSTSGKSHSKGSIGYPASDGTDIIMSYLVYFDKCLYL